METPAAHSASAAVGGVVVVLWLLTIACGTSGPERADWKCVYDNVSCDCTTDPRRQAQVEHCDAEPPPGVTKLPDNRCCMRCEVSGRPNCICSKTEIYDIRFQRNRDAGCDLNGCANAVATNATSVARCPP